MQIYLKHRNAWRDYSICSTTASQERRHRGFIGGRLDLEYGGAREGHESQDEDDCHQYSVCRSSQALKARLTTLSHNPVGKIFSKSELQAIADLCIKHNILILSDEVHHLLTHPT